jgi:predicted nucleotide-binding protein (sugar kinase/HSP70/actin superfamily)
LFEIYIGRVGDLLGTLRGANGLRELASRAAPFEALMTAAARDFRSIRTARELEQQARTVFLSGDIFLRVDEWGSDELALKLNRLGLRVAVEPFSEIFEFLAENRSLELVEMEDRLLRNRALRFWQKRLTQRLYRAVHRVLPFISSDAIADVERECEPLLSDKTPFSESLLTVGSSLLWWRTRAVDGVVVVGPWGCGPALISEAQLRRRTDLPLLFVYNDGDPVDEARMAGFAWRLKRAPSRRATTAV